MRLQLEATVYKDISWFADNQIYRSSHFAWHIAGSWYIKWIIENKENDSWKFIF